MARISSPAREPSINVCRTSQFLFALAIIWPGATALAQWEFVKIADSTTPIPGGGGATFTEFGVPALSRDCLAFYGRSGDFHSPAQVGIFIFDGESFRIVADQFTTVPGGTGVNFWRFGGPSIAGCSAALWGQYPAFPLHEGIYSGAGTTLRVVAGQDTPVPGGTGTFTAQFADKMASDAGNVAFINGFETGVYREIGGDLSVVANLSTPIPEGEGNFMTLSGRLAFAEVSLSGSEVAFVGRGEGQVGIYSTLGEDLTAIADLTTMLPGGTELATDYRGPAIDQEEVAFWASRGPNHSGIYVAEAGAFRVAVDQRTAVPGQPINFNAFEPFTSLEGGNVVFWGRSGPIDNSNGGVYINFAGTIVKILDNMDSLDGKDIVHVTFGLQALRGSRVALKVHFSDSSRAIYVARYLPIFSDGFESGNLVSWSSHAETSLQGAIDDP